MKAARLRLTADSLAKMIGLPNGAEIVSVWQDAEDYIGRSFSISIRGVGPEIEEGMAIKVVTIEELQDGPPALAMGTHHL